MRELQEELRGDAYCTLADARVNMTALCPLFIIDTGPLMVLAVLGAVWGDTRRWRRWRRA